MSTTFDLKVSAWVGATEQRMLAVIKESSKLVVRAAQVGVPGIPVDTGFARASVRASLDSMPKINTSYAGEKDRKYPYDDKDIILVINGMKTGNTLSVGWTAAYVIYLERGHSQQAPNGFIRIAAMQWPAIVARVVAKLKQRVGATEGG